MKVSYLNDKNTSISSDCIKVLYEAAYIKPELIVEYWSLFIEFLNSKSNRMVWGAMIALSQITPLLPKEIYEHLDLIINKINMGTVITSVQGVNVLAKLTAVQEYYDEVMPILLELLKNTRSVDFPKRAEIISTTLMHKDYESFLEIIYNKEPELSNAGIKRLKKVIKIMNKDKA
jgi:hypothetical protein